VGHALGSSLVTGTLLNATGIILGSLAALVLRKDLGPGFEHRARLLISVAAMAIGVTYLWEATHGGMLAHLKQITLLLTAILAGNALGRLIGIQNGFNHIAHFAKRAFATPQGESGFKVASALFCLTPLSILGAVMEGATGQSEILLLKTVMDSLAAFSFTRIFGPGICLAALPVLAWQGNLTLLTLWLGKGIFSPNIQEGMMALSGMMVFVSILLILGVGKPRLGDYLPALGIIGVLAHWFW